MGDRTIVITGASSGVGAAAARMLAERGHRVLVLGRDPIRTAAVADEVGSPPIVADFADLAAVRAAAAAVLAAAERIEVLALNAGGMRFERRITPDGFEATLQSNYLAHVLLERLLHERLVAARGTVVLTSSIGAHVGRVPALRPHPDADYSGFRAYADSKVAGLLQIRELARRGALAAVAFHPGTVDSGFAAAAGGPLAAHRDGRGSGIRKRLAGVRPPERAAAVLVRLAELRAPRGIGGHYLGPDGREARLPRVAADRAHGAAFVRATERLLA